jgi:hypothetical protein
MKTIEPARVSEPKVIKYCDNCGKSCKYSCPHCDRDWCAECIHRGVGVVAYWNSTSPGWVLAVYCTPCDIVVSETGGDEIYQSLTAIRILREKYAALDTEAKAANAHLKMVAAGRGLIA